MRFAERVLLLAACLLVGIGVGVAGLAQPTAPATIQSTRATARPARPATRPTVNAADKPAASRSRRQTIVRTPTPAAHAPRLPVTTGIPALLLRIRNCESGGDYTAENPSSTASGAYQALDSTWGHFAGYRRAKYAPRWVQDRWAVRLYLAEGTRPWAASRSCWG